jgi:hypothetical protein
MGAIQDKIEEEFYAGHPSQPYLTNTPRVGEPNDPRCPPSYDHEAHGRVQPGTGIIMNTDHDEDYMINSPPHYAFARDQEPIKVIRAWGLGFALGNVVKYIARAGRKDQEKRIEDLKKARWYLDDEITFLQTGTSKLPRLSACDGEAMQPHRADLDGRLVNY